MALDTTFTIEIFLIKVFLNKISLIIEINLQIQFMKTVNIMIEVYASYSSRF